MTYASESIRALQDQFASARAGIGILEYQWTLR
jgi:hypothetical protein